VAILKDRDGKIVLDVPVEGSLDDPKFRIRKVVIRAIENILTKVATSPFSLLGALFGGGGEELGYQEFPPGSADLTPVDRTKLDTLAKGLYARPALGLEIAGGVDPAGDRAGLQHAALDREIRARHWTTLRASGLTTNTAEEITLTPDVRAHWIEQLYVEKLGGTNLNANTNFPPMAAAGNTNPPPVPAVMKTNPPVQRIYYSVELVKGAQLLERRLPPVKIAAPAAAVIPPAPVATTNQPPVVSLPADAEALLLATYPVTDADLETLAAARAQAVQAYLLQSGKVEAARLFLKSASAGGLRQDGSRVYLQFR
jgi:hypothetical protein